MRFRAVLFSSAAGLLFACGNSGPETSGDTPLGGSLA